MCFRVSILVGWVHKILHQLRRQISHDYILLSVCLRNAPKLSVVPCFFQVWTNIWNCWTSPRGDPRSANRIVFFLVIAKLDLQEVGIISVCCGLLIEHVYTIYVLIVTDCRLLMRKMMVVVYEVKHFPLGIAPPTSRPTETRRQWPSASAAKGHGGTRLQLGAFLKCRDRRDRVPWVFPKIGVPPNHPF